MSIKFKTWLPTIWWFIAITIIAIGGLISLSQNQPPDSEYIRILTEEGYSNIRLHGYQTLGCGEGDYYSQTFTATKQDRPVKGVVCKGISKGYTIRRN